ncbi:phage integrase family protein [Rhodobacter capsulatus]|uniref:tyrosine-type recombinase/integrase n=1 Tax=Rhodobacter capsulatus TaxID=1061 RepID=UPI0006DC2B86|nr:tyrosine-type recombinase/integrase [Rhodobacter capsulatus]KQB14700.1 hypothetical protein AP073_03440 [Rhodobacter capsulatus]KQB14999.1 hypothetical protein AP071_03690 [Rhodobacter capsulatus]PZX24898.1 phage integrase family protein [Rhodobacter capsulatus]
MDLGDVYNVQEDQGPGRWLEWLHPVTGEGTGLRVKVAGPDSLLAAHAAAQMVDDLAELADENGRVSGADRAKAQRAYLARLDASADAPILCGARGGRLRYKDVAEIMLKERRRLGVEAHDLHALRYTGVQELALAGCDDDEIASYSGHTSKAMIRKYAGEARQLMRALSAREKRG